MNQLLQQTQQQVMAKAGPQMAPAINHVVSAGKQLMFGQQTRHMLFKALAQAAPDKIGQSFAGMAVLLYAQGGKKIPMQILVPAATILLCDGLQFLEDSGKQKVDAAYLSEAEKAMGEMLLRLFHATPQVISKIAVAAGAKQTGAMQPPASAQAMSSTPPQGIIAAAAGGA